MTAANPSSSARFGRALPAMLSAFLGIALYAVSIGGTYIYDDIPIVRDDMRVHDPALWHLIWTRDYFMGGPDNLYRPLVTQSYALQYFVHFAQPWAIHFVNVLLYGVACALVAELARRLAGGRAALISGLLFAAHPIHSEVGAGMVGRADLLCAIGLIGGLILFLRRPMTMGRAAGIGALTVLAMLSKEQGMLMPFLLLALIPARRAMGDALSPGTEGERASPATGGNAMDDRGTGGKLGAGENSRDFIERQPMQWVAIFTLFPVSILIILREQVLKLGFEWDRRFLDWSIQPLIRAAGADQLLIPVALIGRYARLMLFPSHLSLDYGYNVINWTQSFGDPYLYAGFITIGAWLALVCWTYSRRNWPAMFCLLALAITYSMVSNVIVIGAVFNERLFFLPSAFGLMFIGILAAGVPRKILTPMLVIVLGLASLRTYTYVVLWNDRTLLYEYLLARDRNSVRIYTLVMLEAQDHKRLEYARELGAEARTKFPAYSHLWEHCGLIEEDAGDYITALQYYEHAAKILKTVTLANKIVETRKKAAAQAATRAAATQATTRG